MGPESGHRKFCWKIDAGVGDSVSSCDHLSGHQNQHRVSRLLTNIREHDERRSTVFVYVRQWVWKVKPRFRNTRFFKINSSLNRIARMEAVVHICYAHWGAMLDIGENFTDHSIFRRIEEVAPTFKETMYRCKWRTQKKVEQNFPLEEGAWNLVVFITYFLCSNVLLINSTALP